ncbi:MAG: long-chain fatty acid--CoA ligase [Gammaproteobacteria bacterium]|nr:long-chain fatty acid--CoA ligase [Gammaproteobacteria bacterium]
MDHTKFDIQQAITALLRQTTDRYGEQTAIFDAETKISFREFDDLSTQVAYSLTYIGIKPGDRVALYFVNSAEFAINYIGIVKAGAVVVPINLLLTPVEIAFILNDCSASALIYHESLRERVRDTQSLVTDKLHFVSSSSQLAENTDIAQHVFAAHQKKPGEFQVDPHRDLVCILYTSGTTGKPKGAMLTHRNLSSNTTAAFTALGLESGKDRLLVVLPMFHAFAATVGMLMPLLHGCAFIPLPRFEPKLLADTIKIHQATIFLGVPSMYNVLLQHADTVADGFSSICRCVSGGAAMPKQLMRDFEKQFNVPVYEGDGPTECSPVTCINPIQGQRKIASVGLPIPGVEMSIMDGNGQFLPTNTTGEICVRAPSVMAGYWKRPEATAESFFGDWFRTGDLGNMDEDGYFYIVDRIKDMIIVNGMNVYPRVVEEVLYQHPDIREAAVIGEPDELHGENVVAHIVPKEGKTLTASDVRSFCRDKLGRYQIPRKYCFQPELPKNAAGKILKRELRKHGEIERGIDNRDTSEA